MKRALIIMTTIIMLMTTISLNVGANVNGKKNNLNSKKYKDIEIEYLDFYQEYYNREVTLDLEGETPEYIIDFSNEKFRTEERTEANYEMDYEDLVLQLKVQDPVFQKAKKNKETKDKEEQKGDNNTDKDRYEKEYERTLQSIHRLAENLLKLRYNDDKKTLRSEVTQNYNNEDDKNKVKISSNSTCQPTTTPYYSDWSNLWNLNFNTGNYCKLITRTIGAGITDATYTHGWRNYQSNFNLRSFSGMSAGAQVENGIFVIFNANKDPYFNKSRRAEVTFESQSLKVIINSANQKAHGGVTVRNIVYNWNTNQTFSHSFAHVAAVDVDYKDFSKENYNIRFYNFALNPNQSYYMYSFADGEAVNNASIDMRDNGKLLKYNGIKIELFNFQ